MKDCILTKFKVEVNNPNLPVLESMQQFTLDFIEAVGNSSMTDAKKLALNHFFYRIGAIDNNGAYAKLKSLIIPMVAGNVSGALYDPIKGSSWYNSQTVILDDYCLKHTDQVSGSTVNLFDIPNTGGALYDSSYLVSYRDSEHSSSSYTSIAPTGDTIDNYTLTNDFAVTIVPKQNYAKSLEFSNSSEKKVLGLSISGNTSDDIVGFGSADNIVRLDASIRSDFRDVSVDKMRIKLPKISEISVIGYGESMTESEIMTLVKATAELRDAFIPASA